MKKLLGLIGAFGLTASTSATVVACGETFERDSAPALNENLAKEIIAKLMGKDIADIDFGTIFNTGDITTTVINWINELVSEQFNYESTNEILKKLGLKNYESTDDKDGREHFKQIFSELTEDIGKDQLFNSYTKSLAPGNSPMDYSISKQLYKLNVSENKKIKDFDGKEFDIKDGDKIYFDSKPWSFFAEDGDESAIDHLPTIENLTKEYQDGKAVFSVGSKAGEHTITSKTAISLRFQDYFKNKVQKDILANALVMAFNQSSMFSIRENTVDKKNEAFINTVSSVFQKAQEWRDTNEAWKTNIKLVWTQTFDNEKRNDVRKVLDGLDKLIDKSDGTLLEDQSIKDVFKEVEKAKDAGSTPPPLSININNNKANLSSNLYDDEGGEDPGGGEGGETSNSELGYDSFFGLSGFNGFTLYQNGSAVGDSPISGKIYEENIKSYNDKRGGVLLNKGTWFFQNSDKNKFDVVFVLPVYMIELMGASQSSKAYEDANSSTYKIFGNKNVDDKNFKELQFGQNFSNKDRFKTQWNLEVNKKLHSKDIQDIASDSVKQEEMFKQIQYMISKDSANIDIAKKVIYSKYLDPEELYYKGIWDSIGSYIKDDENDDE